MKKILALTLAMMMVLALCACGAKEEAPAEVAPEAVVEAAPEAAPEAAEAAPAEGDASGEMGASGEMASGEPSAEQLNASQDFEITVDGVTGTAHYEDTDNGDQATKGFVITFEGKTVEGAIDKGVWTATSGDAADQAIVDAVKVAFEGGNVVGPQA